MIGVEAMPVPELDRQRMTELYVALVWPRDGCIDAIVREVRRNLRLRQSDIRGWSGLLLA